MRLVSYDAGDGPAVGVRVDGAVAPTGYRDMVAFVGDGERALERARRAAAGSERVSSPRLLAPVPRPGKMLFCGVNYASHAEENPDAVMPSEPFFFSKMASAVVGPGEPIVLPSPETHGDYEVELAAVIGRPARRVRREDALAHVFGYTVVNDVSARDVQFRDAQITLGKNADTFCPMGPELLTADEAPEPGAFHVVTRVNGEERQRSGTDAWLFGLDELIAFVSRTITLEPGDLVTTGTPAGVAAFRTPPPWLRPGDEVSVEVEEIGALVNPVVAGWSEA
jgi:2-keto-4-pentenoate hydratase/2-oxohepta-3-ene-1,7-dioic acid hydratase in catechol pathway